ncbi:MAG: sulfotransferase, partial [Planctomycetes bacterium]|nr:sulfotransferase [Planctomycetota bacterium]
MTDSRQNPWVFVVGCPRSGTTLLQRMLDHHPQLAVANDTHFIPKAIEKAAPREIENVTRGADLPLTTEIVEWVRSYYRFPRLELSDETVLQAAARSTTYREFVAALYGEYASLRGKQFSGEKTPDYVRRLRLLHALFPWAKVVHIIRDGRDVCLSTLDWAREDKGPGKFDLWDEEPVAVCALWWSWQVSTGMREGMALGPSHYHELRYEELVAKPEETLRSLAAFLELP